VARLGAEQHLDALGTEDALHFVRHVGIFPTHEPSTRLDNGDPTAEPTIGLRHLDSDIAAASTIKWEGR
jgi:hypothetical protein